MIIEEGLTLNPSLIYVTIRQCWREGPFFYLPRWTLSFVGKVFFV